MSNPTEPESVPTTQPFQPPPGEGMVTPPPANAYPGYPAGYQPNTTPPVTPSPAPRRRGAGGAIVATLVILAALAGGGLYALGRNGTGPLANIVATATIAATATPTSPPTATPTPTPPAGYSYFIATDRSYRIAYPVGWVPLEQTANGVTGLIIASDLNATNIFLVFPSPQKVQPSQYQAFLTQVLNSLPIKNQVADVKLSSTTTTATLGANTWTSDTGTLTLQGKPYSGTVLGTDWKTGTFLAVYAAPTATFTATEQQYFTTMATSLTIFP